MAMRHLKSVELIGFKSFGKKTTLEFGSTIAAIVGPNGSGKSNVAEGFRFVLGEQSMKSLRSKRGEDLIWGGSTALPRANRAAVKVVFDNTPTNGKRLLDIDFSEVVVERVVHRDGANEYLLNGTLVRLKDVIRLLAGAHIGGSGYQIISQGEADRILNASPKERREMVEDALGLKLYQHKKLESERKLEETAVNIDKTKSLRREIAPHIKFLGAQVEKIEKAREMREELSHRLAEYLAREDAWLKAEETQRAGDGEEARKKVRELEAETKRFKAEGPHADREGNAAEILRGAEGELGVVRRERERLMRELGRAEGALEAQGRERVVPIESVRAFAREVDEELGRVINTHDPDRLHELVASLRVKVRTFSENMFGAEQKASPENDVVAKLTKELADIQEKEIMLAAKTEEARRSIERMRESQFAEEQEALRREAQLREALSTLALSEGRRAELARARERFKEEVREGVALVGEAVRNYEKWEIPDGALSEDRSAQEKRRRDLERLKIKIEESGIGNSEAVVKEFSQTRERDEFLGREVADLEASAAKLKDIIADLEQTMDEKFTEGLERINEALSTFFTKLFGGGEAKLYIEKPRHVRRGPADFVEEEVDGGEPDEDELYTGLTISISLPRKKVRGLEVLSGGERALTSIALIFAMSQVHPPPFLILDETDAALDEANSRRFADMIKELSKRSQLVVITHNRATMAAAGELYGVTMGSDGVSKLLSVKLEEAERVAK